MNTDFKPIETIKNPKRQTALERALTLIAGIVLLLVFVLLWVSSPVAGDCLLLCN